MNLKYYIQLAKKIRLEILEIIYKSKSSHLGSCFSIVDCSVWGQKYKKKISTELKKWNEIIILEDHLIDYGFFSYISEINRSIKARSISLNSNIIGKVGSQKYLYSLSGLK